MTLTWTDSQALAEALLDAHPDVDPQGIRFTDLYDWVLALTAFDDVPERCNERVLEAIQQCWIDEYN